MSVTTSQRTRISGIGVLDKASTLLAVVEEGPASLAELVAVTGYARPTVHRIACGMEQLGLLARDFHGRFVVGPRLGNIALEVHQDRLAREAAPVLEDLHALTGLHARLFRRHGAMQVCIATSDERTGEPGHLPIGTARPATSGPVAQVLLAWEAPGTLYEALRGARFTAAQLVVVRQRGWAHGPDPLALGRVCTAVPVCAPGNRVVAALSLTGPADRMAGPRRQLLGAALDAAGRLGDGLGRARVR
ncbi:IclR family transcriptional regulator [Streptomyces sp. NBRC 14336]|jgi:DNA-binding IclR family transcriptional regulator|uniref:IclR family transcriptional regulator n=1 Tax=Streptomyces sp. NBRC 14336 TaxID=3030992 RepID=UPI00249FC0D4|nr:helix-turn-helix domain-containing protein [Streptomyces sp. NBRC 14336]WBO80832.1 helix-turn-helix domain-containing protein [Streptomyces sp. SBE_14.2]GLW48089.1 IclR family transcriptional regulator [Streptomyces sp. NBRC 14336]